MGSPLGPTFAELYMYDLENRVLLSDHLKPNSYARLLMTFLLLFGMSHTSSHWKWKWRHNLLFRLLLRWILTTQCHFWTSRFTKKKISTKQLCSESPRIQENVSILVESVQSSTPDRYKRSVIRAYLHRAHKTCSFDHLLQQETLRIKQILINNGFTNTDVDREISKFFVKPISDEQNLKLFYENKMSDAYNVDERVLKNMYYFPLI